MKLEKFQVDKYVGDVNRGRLWYEVARTRDSTRSFQRQDAVDVTAFYQALPSGNFSVLNTEVVDGVVVTINGEAKATPNAEKRLLFTITFENIPFPGTYEIIAIGTNPITKEYAWALVTNGVKNWSDPTFQAWILAAPRTNFDKAYYDALNFAVNVQHFLTFDEFMNIMKRTQQTFGAFGSAPAQQKLPFDWQKFLKLKNQS